MRFQNSNLRSEDLEFTLESLDFGFQVSNLKSQISNRRAQPRRAGLTLLELTLALSLSVVLLFAVGMALRLYWRSFDVKRTNVEQAHLARAILSKMEMDIRSAVQYTPVDLSGLDTMMASSGNLASALGGATGGGSSGAATGGSSPGGAGATGGASATTTGGSTTGGATGGASGSSTTQTQTSQSGQGAGGGGSTSAGASANSGATKTGGASSTQSGGTQSSSGNSTSGGSSGASASGQPAAGDATATDTTADTPPAVVGLYGSANQLQFDVSRLPRVDEYAGGSPASMVQIPSDIKTVTYYVRNETTAGSSSSAGGTPTPGSSEPSATGQGRGLMRLELDRAVSAYGESNGSVSAGYDKARLLADEVTSITFRYWNGTEWATDWNSDEMGGLPLAVEVVMTMTDPNAVATKTPPVPSFGAAAGTTSTDPSYRIVVNLPTASLPPPVEEPATEGNAAASGTGAAGTSGTSSSGGGATSGSSTAGSSGGATSGASGGSSPSYGTGSTIPGTTK